MKSYLFFIILAFASLNVFAQQTGNITGQVVDSQGGVVVGAQVIAVDANAKEKTVVTNKDGEFNVSGLAPGKYIVRVVADKFGLYEQTDVNVASGASTEPLVIALSVEAIKEEVQVNVDNNVSTDQDNNASATVLKGEALDALPDDPDDLEAALQALAGPSAGPNGGQIYIDGFTGGRLPPKESIREIRINSNPFSAEFDRLGFGRIEILTKPGTDRFRGSLGFNFNDESLNSRNPFAANRAPTQQRFFNGNFSGPLKKGKASYFVDFSQRTNDSNAVVNATILDPSFNIVQFRRDFTTPSNRFSISPRVDYQLNTNNTLVARYSFTRFRAEDQGFSGFSLPTRGYDSSSTEHEFRLTETAILNPKTINETRFEYSVNRRDTTGDNSIPSINVSGAFNGGGAQIGNNFNDSNRYEITNNTTTSFGANNQHSVKFGGRLRGVSIKDNSESGFGGAFTFAGVRDPLTGNVIVSSIEQYRQRLLGNPDPIYYPNQFTITGGNPLAKVSQFDVGFFATDDWKITPQFTLSFGLRYENQNNIDDNGNFAPRVSFAYALGGSGARQAQTVIRGGAGIFYERFGENNTLNVNRFNGTNQVQYIVTSGAILGQSVFTQNGVSNVPTIAQLSALAPGSFTVRRTSDDLKAPTTYQWSLSVERQLPFKTRGAIYYVGSRSIHQLRVVNVNAPVCGFTTTCPTATAAINALRPNPTAGNIFEFQSNGDVNQQQIIFNLNSSVGSRVTFGANYRLGVSRDNVGSPLYSYDYSTEYGYSSNEVRHYFGMFASIRLPWDVRMSPFITATSGGAFNITNGLDTNRDTNFNERPTYQQLSDACTRRGLNFSFCDIGGVVNPLTTIIPRNYGRGPGSVLVNLNFNKTIGFGGSKETATAGSTQGSGGAGRGGGRGGRGGGGGFGGPGGGGGMFGGASDKPYNLTFGLQITNLFNRVNLGYPVSNLSSDRFGEYNSIQGGGFGGRFGGGSDGTANRKILLSVRFSF
jgi:hypothetical protein